MQGEKKRRRISFKKVIEKITALFHLKKLFDVKMKIIKNFALVFTEIKNHMFCNKFLCYKTSMSFLYLKKIDEQSSV
jgi:hypothetical protein